MSSNVYLNHLEFYLPKKIEKNYDILLLNKKNKQDAKKMISKIGIKKRHISENNITANILASHAAKKIFSEYDKNSFDFLIYCTNSPDFILPPNSCLLQNKIKLKNIGCIDINLSCSGYVYSLGIAKSLILSKQANQILLITSDTYSKFISKKDYKNRIIFGDGSTASIISNKKSKNSFKINNFIYGTDGSGGNFAIFKNFGANYLHNKKKEIFDMNGPGILSFALKEVPDSINKYLKKNKISLNKIDKFIFHQANEFIIDSLKIKLNIPDNKVIKYLSDTGNTVSSSIPIALKKSENQFKKGEKILLVGFGGGLSWGVGLIEKN